jgi:predicted ATPase/DNA-binding CsgD family transcriptional regulator/tetratricopeptide (TPR) repeat protein
VAGTAADPAAARGGRGPEELGRYEATRLFCDRAAAAQPGFALTPANLPAVAALCRSLDGVPLAIELAAAWVRVLSVEQILARLDDRFRLLTSGDRTAPPRQRTLRAAIDWSHDLLAEREQVLLRRLSVFAGWSLEMAEQLCSGSDLAAADVLGLLATLADKSLVVADTEGHAQTRYRMLDTIRDYAASRLAEAGEVAMMQQRLRDYSLRETEHMHGMGMALIPAPWSASVETFRRFDVEADNLRQVLSHCLADGDAETGLRICVAARPVWIVRGSFAEGTEWLDAFLGLDSPGVPAAVRGAALVGRAQLALASDPASAEASATEGLEVCRAAGAGFWVSTALNLLAEASLHAGQADEAAARADRALKTARRDGQRWNEGYALGTMAAVAGQRGDLSEAQRLAEAALDVMRDIDQQWGVARTLLGLADLARLTADPGGAQQRYAEALAILREVNARPEIARCLAGLGRIAMEQGEITRARQYLTESIGPSRSMGNRIGMIRGLEAFAALAAKDQRPDRAVQLAAAAAALREAARLPSRTAARTERLLAAADSLGPDAIARLWTEGSGLEASSAVELALTVSLPGAADDRGDPPRPSAGGTSPGGLTPRERQIVALIAGGRSNRAIADELVISPARAARHVANILLKLSFSSRAQVAAWAAGRASADDDRTGPRAG